jgi:hypothetical protein
MRAANVFVEAAFDMGELKPLFVFRKKYRIMDAGIDIKKGTHDNFVDNMTPDGFQRMALFLKDYVEEHGVRPDEEPEAVV